MTMHRVRLESRLTPEPEPDGKRAAALMVHRVAERVDLWVCRFAGIGERGTCRVDLVTCPDCRAGRYAAGGPPVRPDILRSLESS
jgi:hypothetical protein